MRSSGSRRSIGTRLRLICGRSRITRTSARAGSARGTCGTGGHADRRTRRSTAQCEQNHADGTGPGTRPLRRLAVNPDLRSAVELANAAKRRCDAEHDTGRGTWVSILLEEVFEACAEDDPARLRAELVQVAAVALQWADAIDRRTMGATK